MIVTEPSPDVVSFSAEPEWLDDVIRQLQEEAGRPSRSAGRERKRNMARDILECGYIGPTEECSCSSPTAPTRRSRRPSRR